MGNRVALVACKNSCDGVWSIAKGNEKGIRISGLGKGEHVIMSIEIGELRESVNYYDNGVFPLPWARMERYRVSKLVNPGVTASPTTVEITLNGNASSIRRDADDRVRTS